VNGPTISRLRQISLNTSTGTQGPHSLRPDVRQISRCRHSLWHVDEFHEAGYAHSFGDASLPNQVVSGDVPYREDRLSLKHVDAALHLNMLHDTIK
jgi:hypothetical protein